MTTNRIIRDLRAARAPARFTGADRWALDVVTARPGAPQAEHCRILAWAHLKSRRGQPMRQTVVQSQARARAALRATLAHHARHAHTDEQRAAAMAAMHDLGPFGGDAA